MHKSWHIYGQMALPVGSWNSILGSTMSRHEARNIIGVRWMDAKRPPCWQRNYCTTHLPRHPELLKWPCALPLWIWRTQAGSPWYRPYASRWRRDSTFQGFGGSLPVIYFLHTGIADSTIEGKLSKAFRRSRTHIDYFCRWTINICMHAHPSSSSSTSSLVISFLHRYCPPCVDVSELLHTQSPWPPLYLLTHLSGSITHWPAGARHSSMDLLRIQCLIPYTVLAGPTDIHTRDP